MKKEFTPILACCIMFSILGSCSNTTTNDEQTIRAMYAEWGPAIASKDVDKIMSFYATADTLVFFDAFPPREYKGTNVYRKDYENFFAAFPGPAKSAITDLHVTASGSLAYAYGIDEWEITGQNNQPINMVFRFTDVLQKINGKWLIVHEHLSFPVDPSTGMADFLSKS
jgi:ketosteroid isomerase-like protein